MHIYRTYMCAWQLRGHFHGEWDEITWTSSFRINMTLAPERYTWTQADKSGISNRVPNSFQRAQVLFLFLQFQSLSVRVLGSQNTFDDLILLHKVGPTGGASKGGKTARKKAWPRQLGSLALIPGIMYSRVPRGLRFSMYCFYTLGTRTNESNKQQRTGSTRKVWSTNCFAMALKKTETDIWRGLIRSSSTWLSVTLIQPLLKFKWLQTNPPKNNSGPTKQKKKIKKDKTLKKKIKIPTKWHEAPGTLENRPKKIDKLLSDTKMHQLWHVGSLKPFMIGMFNALQFAPLFWAHRWINWTHRSLLK